MCNGTMAMTIMPLPEHRQTHTLAEPLTLKCCHKVRTCHLKHHVALTVALSHDKNWPLKKYTQILYEDYVSAYVWPHTVCLISICLISIAYPLMECTLF